MTVIETVATFDGAAPSEALYVKLSEPLKFADGVYVNEPSTLNGSVPCDGPVTSEAVIESPSGSLSLPSTPGAATVSAVSSFVEYVSFVATGGSLPRAADTSANASSRPSPKMLLSSAVPPQLVVGRVDGGAVEQRPGRGDVTAERGTADHISATAAGHVRGGHRGAVEVAVAAASTDERTLTPGAAMFGLMSPSPRRRPRLEKSRSRC